MKYLMDTDWIIDALNGLPTIVEKVKEFREEGAMISIVSVAEIYEGIFGSRDPEKHEKIFKDFLTGVTVVEITEEVCRKFGELRNNLRKKRELIGDFDTLIASTALTNNLILLTDNIEHYEKIKELKIKTSE
jgi:tRNA(fMet)-specific endonuclease VapC